MSVGILDQIAYESPVLKVSHVKLLYSTFRHQASTQEI